MWHDSHSETLGWNNIKEIRAFPITTIGFVISEDDDMLIISHSLGNVESDDPYHYDIFTIPKGCIAERKELSL